jgi:GTP-binding protein YchF
MSLNCGIVGLPNVGKSTLFNALTAAKAAVVANYPFCTIDPNVGIVQVPDARLAALSALYHPKKTTPTTVEFVDIAGLVKGASQGEGLGNKFLSHIREVDAIVHVVRCFEDPDVVHVAGKVDPDSDVEIINTELILADLETAERRKQTAEKRLKTSDKKARHEAELMARVVQHLGEGKPARSFPVTDEDMPVLADLRLLSGKPLLYVANVAEGDVAAETSGEPPNSLVAPLRRLAEREGAPLVVISGKVEEEIALLPEADRPDFLAGLGLKESGLDRLAHAAYGLLGLLTFFTSGEDECRAWTVTAGTKAPAAAGKIHSDIEKGFIRAEVMSCPDLLALKSTAAVKEKGLLRLEGKEYVVKDGDVIYFRFNV